MWICGFSNSLTPYPILSFLLYILHFHRLIISLLMLLYWVLLELVITKVLLSRTTHHSNLSLQERPPHRLWRFNPLLLSSSEFVTYVSNQIDIFLLTNPVDDTSSSIYWEASYTSHANALCKHRISDLTFSILHLDQQCAVNPTPELLKDGIALQTEFDLLTTQLTEESLCKSRHKLYEVGNKLRRLLAHRLC